MVPLRAVDCHYTYNWWVVWKIQCIGNARWLISCTGYENVSKRFQERGNKNKNQRLNMSVCSKGQSARGKKTITLVAMQHWVDLGYVQQFVCVYSRWYPALILQKPKFTQRRAWTLNSASSLTPVRIFLFIKVRVYCRRSFDPHRVCN